MDKSKKSTYIIAGVTLVLLVVGMYFLFVFRKGDKQLKPKEFTYGEVKQITEIDADKRPFVTLTPTSDGAEIIISIENMGHFDNLEYEMTYQADNPAAPGSKIQRGSTGTDINTKDQKYKTSILLGTASRGVRSPDRGIIEGKLTMHLFKGEQEYLSDTNWDIVQAGLKAGSLESRDGKVKVGFPALGKDYWVILGDTVGIPAGGSFDYKKVVMPVYGVFSIAGDFTTKGSVSVKAEADGQMHLYNNKDNSWQESQSSYSDGSVQSDIQNFSTFVISSK